MSTLTSSQLHVKRSSTRLHAPPGGVSSITFGPGGLGTVDTAVEDDGIGEKAGALNPADVLQPPPRTGAYTSNNNNSSSSSGYDYAPQKGRTPGGYGSANAMSSGYGYNNNSNNSSNNSWGGDPYGQLPSTGMMPQQQQQHYGAGPPTSGPPRQLSSASSSGSWGSQPPLTSSKRDQNWERKRRQWLARKNGSMGGSAVGFSGGGTSRLHSAGPPGSSSYGSNMGVGMNPWEDHGNANAPPSPLSKFVHQQSQKQHQQGDLFGYDYERIGTAQSQASFSLPQPPATAAYPRGDVYSSGGGGGGGYPYAPPSRSGGPYNPTPPSSSGESIGPQGRMSHFNNAPPPQAASEFGYGCGGYGHYGSTVTPGSRDGPSVAGVSTSRGGNTGNRNVSSAARQPPGGHSNWSPFS